MKTSQEILNRMKEVESADLMGTQRSDLLEFLPFEDAKEFLKPEVTLEEWTREVYKAPTEENIKARILDYMPFAWGKANDCRGLSAGRSLQHMSAWLWLLGDNELVEYLEQEYSHYGKPQLKKICEKYDWDWKQWHDGYAGNCEDSQVESDLSNL